MRTDTEAGRVTSDDQVRALVDHVMDLANSPHEVASGDQDKRKTVRRLAAARNLYFLDQLHRVLDKVNAAGVRVIVLKGAALTDSLYPHLGLRIFGDIDLLVRREKLPQLTAILGNLGYEHVAAEPSHQMEEFQGESGYLKRGHLPILIEPHWSLGPYPYSARVEVDGLWHRAKRLNLAGIDTLVLCPEDCLLHLCLHLFQHGQGGQVSCCDIAELLSHYQTTLDWAAFVDKVFRFRVGLPVRYSLQKTTEVFGKRIPAEVMEELDRYRPTRFEKSVFASLFDSGLGVGDGARSLAVLLALPGVRPKLRYARAVFAPSRGFVLAHYKGARSRLLSFYYVLWVAETFWRACKASIRLAFVRSEDSVLRPVN